MILFRSILFILLYIYFGILKIYALEYTVSNNDVDFKRLRDFINGHQNSEEIILYFKDSEYDFSDFHINTIDIPVQTNMIFKGNENGTVFDFKKIPKGRLIFLFSCKGESVTIENITFENYSSNGIYDVEMIILNVSSDNYYFNVNNCVFQNNNYRIFRIDASVQKVTRNTPSILISNCKF